MKMRFLGVGAYHQIASDGDFAYRVDGDAWELHRWCPKFRACVTKIHRREPDAKTATWQWDGNLERPTIAPSIGCDAAPRCGRHVTVTAGEQI